MYNLKFVNHASFLVETNDSILLVDPWVEGYAFDKGWALLDKSTSNDQLLDFLSNSEKKINIWYSHEHSDHFSVPFLMGLKKRKLDAQFYFQKTLDGRVANFMRQQGFSVIESNDKLEILDSELSIVTFPFSGGDSYSLILVNGCSILNINDCFIQNDIIAANVAASYKKYTDTIDLLLTQFGYANWTGNENEEELRVQKSALTLSLIKLQVEVFCPRFVIPFASFIYFCHPDNFYLNDMQNSPKDVENFFKYQDLPADLIVLKPWDDCCVPINVNEHDNERLSENLNYWEGLTSSISSHMFEKIKYTENDVFTEHKNYRRKLFKSFLFLPELLDRLGILPRLNVLVTDLNATYQISYFSGIRQLDSSKEDVDISLTSATLLFILKHEYGADTVQVNGKFKRISEMGDRKFIEHFSPQFYMKIGLGIKHPLISLRVIAGKLVEKLIKRSWQINPSSEP